MGIFANRKLNSKTGELEQEIKGLEKIAKKADIKLPINPQKEPKTGLLSKVGSVLSSFETAPAVSALMKGENPYEAYKTSVAKGLTAEEDIATKKSYTSVLEDAGWKSSAGTGSLKESATWKNFGKEVVGLTADILLDPTTYLTLGASALPKLGGKTLTKTGVQVLKNEAKIESKILSKQLLEQGIKKTEQEISKEALKIAGERLVKSADKKLFDQGGVKFAGKTLISGETLGKPTKAVKTILGKSETGEKLVEGLGKVKTSLGKTFYRDFNLPEKYVGLKQKYLDSFNSDATDIVKTLTETFKGTNKKTREAISYAIERNDYSGLGDFEAKIAQDAKNIFESIAKQESERGLLETTLDDYVTHIYGDKEKAMKYLEFQNVGVKGGATEFAKKRTIPTLEEAEKLGLKPEKDVAKILSARLLASAKAMREQDLLKQVGQDFGEKSFILKDEDKTFQEWMKKEEGLFKNQDEYEKELSNYLSKKYVDKFEGELEDQYQNFKKLRLMVGEIEDASQLKQIKKNIPSNKIDNILYSQEYNIDEVFEMFKQRLLDERQSSRIRKPFLNKIDIDKEREKFIKENLIKNPQILANDLVEYTNKEFKGLVIPRQIAEDLKNLSKKTINNEEINKFLRGYDILQNFFKGSVTVLFPAFHGRNFISNVAQNFLDIGVKSLNPISNLKALNILRSKSNGTLTTKLGEKYTYKELRRIMQEKGILGSPGVRDVAETVDQQLAKGLSKVKQANPASVMRGVGNAIENHARAINFLSNIEKGFSLDDAAKRTKQFLFDYNNLSEFEKTVARRAIPFYTWTRKNIELQARTLATKPGLIGAELKMQRLGSQETEQERQALPEYISEGLAIKAGNKKGLVNYLVGMGLPIENFFSNLPQGISRKEMTDYLNKLASQSAFIPKYIAELATGHEFFRNKPIKDNYTANEFAEFPQFIKDFLELKENKVEYTDKNTGKKVKYTQWIGNPYKIHLLRNLPTSRITSTAGGVFDENQTAVGRLLKYTTGVRIYPVDVERMEQKELKNYIKEVEDILTNYGELVEYSNTYEPKNKGKTTLK